MGMGEIVDAHAHAVFAGVERLSLDLTAARSVEETLGMIRVAAERSDAPWITGGGWNHELLPEPTRRQLDEIVPDRPVALSDAGHHTLWVNSRALELAGVDRDTPQPHNGRIHLDADGDPTGYLNETAAELVGRVIPPATEDEMYAGLRNAQEYLWSLGITGWHEAILGEYNGKADATPAYLRAIAEATLRSDTSGALWIAPGLREDDVPALVGRFVERRGSNARAGFATSTAKAMIDGVPHGETAALLAPYCNHDDGFAGELHFDEGAIRAFVAQLDDTCAPGAATAAAFVADAATGSVTELERAIGGIAVEWYADGKLAIAGDHGVTIVPLDGSSPTPLADADGLASPRRKPQCSPEPVGEEPLDDEAP